MKKKEKTESQIQLDITRFLDSTPLKDLYTITNASLTTKGRHIRRGKAHRVGWPDITGCLPGGRMSAIEVKTATGKLSKDQKEVMIALSQAGAVAIVARSVRTVSDALYGSY